MEFSPSALLALAIKTVAGVELKMFVEHLGNRHAKLFCIVSDSFKLPPEFQLLDNTEELQSLARRYLQS